MTRPLLTRLRSRASTSTDALSRLLDEAAEAIESHYSPSENQPVSRERKPIPSDAEILEATRILAAACHGRSWNGGWYHDPATGEEVQRNFGEVIALMHSELSEALEGYRKNLMDDKLPHRKMVPVELCDAIIRIFDTLGKEYPDDLPALLEKMHYNDNRADHKPENRLAENGKRF